MSDLLSLLSGASSSNLTQSELLVQSYKQTRKSEVDALNTKKTALENKQVFFNSLKSKLDSLVGSMDAFDKEDINSDFITRKVTVSDSSFFTASADSDAAVSSTTVKVNRLATNDTLVSKQLALADTSLFSELMGERTISFQINGSNYDASFTLDGTETAEQVMNKIAKAVNDTEDIKLNASLIKDTSTTGRMSFTASDSGANFKLNFTDSPVLEKLGITQAALNPDTITRTVMNGTEAGYQKADYNALTSEIVIGGITVVRDSNSIDDALPGITFSLIKPQGESDQVTTISTAINPSAVKSLIQPLLDQFNSILQFASNNRTMLRSDTAVSSLRYKLRAIASDEVTSVNNGDPKRLMDVGIKIATDGTLSVGDEDALLDVLKDDPLKVAALFTSSDGFITKIQEAVANLTGDDGLIQARKTSIGDQIDLTKKKTVELESRIEAQANILRKEYESMLKVMLEAQNQYSFLYSYSN